MPDAERHAMAWFSRDFCCCSRMRLPDFSGIESGRPRNETGGLDRAEPRGAEYGRGVVRYWRAWDGPSGSVNAIARAAQAVPAAEIH